MDISRRIGRFIIPRRIITDEPQLVMSEVMARCIVVRAEMMWENGAIEYLAQSPDFEPVRLGTAAPFYDLEIIGPNARFVRRAA